MSKEEVINPEEDSPDNKEASSEQLAEVSVLTKVLLKKQKEASEVEAKLKEIKADVFRLETETIPRLMESIGMSEFKLSDGTKIAVADVIAGSLPSQSAIQKQKDPQKRAEMDGERKKGIAYLNKHGGGSLVKREVKAVLGPKSSKLEREVSKLMRSVGVKPETSVTVNAQSLSAWIRERMQDGKEVDQDLFKVFNGKKLTVKKPRKTNK